MGREKNHGEEEHRGNSVRNLHPRSVVCDGSWAETEFFFRLGQGLLAAAIGARLGFEHGFKGVATCQRRGTLKNSAKDAD
jgi:hypothetical protein